uniref:Bifunctional glutamate/proline--tRNA ligase n=1 Tax=Glossina brevipalpis TaxID=37001 RepID=A0A1A9WPS7_9MUSC
MALKLTANIKNPPISGLATAHLINDTVAVNIVWGNETSLLYPDGRHFICHSNNDVLRALARAAPTYKLYGETAIERTQIDHWLSFSLTCEDDISWALNFLDKSIAPVTYLVANKLTIADFALFNEMHSRYEFLSSKGIPQHVQRWYDLINAQSIIQKVLQSLPDEAKASVKKVKNITLKNKEKDTSPLSTKTNERKQEGKFVDLPGAEKGKVIVRFPPEASGYLHIGHAKAALLNQYYAQAFDGKLIMRFDDTNPAKETVEFENVILGDLELLQIKPDLFTHTSNYFDLMLQYCEQLIKEGKAYVDDTPPEQMKLEREQRLESQNRGNDVSRNMSMWQEMLNGSDCGQKCCVRAKIDMSSANGCMRDPTIYRCKNEPHPRTGTKYKVYPTYDFACPIVDAIENVTHTLRTMEYHDRDEQFYWFIDALKLRRPYIWEYSRLNMTNTVLSKRKLTWFVESGLVDGWDDPRFPTVRGIIRRGMTVEGLKEFIIAQGSSKSVVFMNWDKIWAFNKKVIDPIAPRYTALEYDNRVVVNVMGAKKEQIEVPIHPKNDALGKKMITLGPKIYIDYVDAEALKEKENATFINWGNLMINKIHKNSMGKIIDIDASLNLDNKDFKKTLKLTWLAVEDEENIYPPTYCVYFDNIINKSVLGKDEDFKQYIGHKTREESQMLGDPELKKCKKGDIIQLQRRGFFKVDNAYQPPSPYTNVISPVILFSIPDGHTKDMPSSGLKINSISNQDIKKPPTDNTLNSINDESTTIVNVDQLLSKISSQGDKIRQLKVDKAQKSVIEGEVKILLNLKTQYKQLTGNDWKPNVAAACSEPIRVKREPNPDPPVAEVIAEYLKRINLQGDKVRQLKAKKVIKPLIDPEIHVLLALKSDYKSLTGKDWTPDAIAPVSLAGVTIDLTESQNDDVTEILDKIKFQGDIIRKLKSEKFPKPDIDAEVQVLLSLKAQYKTITGEEWTPNTKSGPGTMPVKVESSATIMPLSEKELLTKEINEQGEKVRSAKANKASPQQTDIDTEVSKLLALKAKYKEVTGTDFPTPARSSGGAKKPIEKKEPQKNLKKESSPPSSKTEPVTGTLKKQTRLGLEATKEDNLPEWYSQVITKGELIEYYDVSGCYILRPWSFAIWKFIKNWFDVEITKMGVKECYFPIFVSKTVLEREKTHIADFAPEVAWVTKSGDSDLAEPIAVRPTSETVMYPAYAKWIQSYRDLPIRLNQWNNVVRWEFKHPQPFLRTREFLWQEGHTAFATKAEADKEVLEILDLYARIYTDLLAVPVVKGRKTEKEKFAGGDYTTTVEAFISASGRGIQGGTSHHLGQNFSKMFEIIYEDPETQQKQYIYQNSWGLTTRTIGVMIMIHADNQGIVLPPHVACIQAIIVPCGITVNTKDVERTALMNACKHLEEQLNDKDIRCEGDYRDNYSPGWKFNHWELKGVPVRIELGPKDMKAEQIVAVRRDTGEKLILAMDDVEVKIKQLLETIHDSMLAKAKTDLTNHTKLTKNWSDFCQFLDRKNILLAPFCGETPCEDKIKADSARDEEAEPGAPAMGAKSLCIPFEQPASITAADKCIHPGCTNKPKYYTLFGRSY